MVRRGENEMTERQLSGGACSTSTVQLTGTIETNVHPRVLHCVSGVISTFTA